MSPLSSLFRVTSSSFLVLSLVDIDISPISGTIFLSFLIIIDVYFYHILEVLMESCFYETIHETDLLHVRFELQDAPALFFRRTGTNMWKFSI